MNEKEIIDYWLNMEHQQPVQLATQDAYWQHYRIQAAIAAMQSIADALGSVDYNKELIAKHAVELADALIAELQKKEEQNGRL